MQRRTSRTDSELNHYRKKRKVSAAVGSVPVGIFKPRFKPVKTVRFETLTGLSV